MDQLHRPTVHVIIVYIFTYSSSALHDLNEACRSCRMLLETFFGRTDMQSTPNPGQRHHAPCTTVHRADGRRQPERCQVSPGVCFLPFLDGPRAGQLDWHCAHIHTHMLPYRRHVPTCVHARARDACACACVVMCPECFYSRAFLLCILKWCYPSHP